MATCIQVGRFRPEDRCSLSRCRVAQEQIEYLHVRAISCAGYSVASTKRSTCAFNPSESSYLLYSPRAFPLVVAALLSMRDAKCRKVEPRERGIGRNKEDCTVEREDDGMRRQGESYWFFQTSDRRDGEGRWGGDGWKRTARHMEAVRARRKESFLPSLFCPVAFGEVFSVPYLCCHSNSLDSREELEKTRSRWITQREKGKKRTQRENSEEKPMFRGQSLCSRFPCHPQELTRREVQTCKCDAFRS